MPSSPIVFYDGNCGLCHRSVRLLASLDHKALLRFAPIGGLNWKRHVPAALQAAPPATVVLLTSHGVALVRSEAVLECLRLTGGGWARISRACHAVPPAWRDAVYDWIARNRLRWFGPAPACPPLEPAMHTRLLP